MRARWTLAIGLYLGLVLPAAAIAAPAPVGTSKQDTAVAYYSDPDGPGCLIMTLTQGLYRPIGGATWSYGQALDVQLAATCTTYETGSVSLDSSSYRIFPITAAYVVASVSVDGHPVDVDLAWVANGTPHHAVEGADLHPDWSFVGQEVGAHLSGTVSVDGEAWTADQSSAILRSFSVSKSY